MCGILFLKTNEKLSEKEIFSFKDALIKQSWRGPDNTNFILSENRDWILGHNRLSILDLSDNGNQPFKIQNSLISYNGEIYNYKELVKKYELKTNTVCDTELVAYLANKSKNEYIRELEGMFAYVLVNKKSGDWHAARDIFGIKPLYYYYDEKLTVVGSEPSAIASITNSSIDHEALIEWEVLRRPCPGYTFFKGVKELPAGNVIKYENNKISLQRYDAKLHEIYINQNLNLKEIIFESVKNHQIADCPITTMLSGGVDSTLITNFANNSKESYSIGSTSFNEFSLAKQTAKIIKKKLHQINLESNSLNNIWNELTSIRGEPLSVPNEASIYFLCKSIPNKTKVILTGEGADEIFMGYSRIILDVFNKNLKNKNDFYKRYSYSDNKLKTCKLTERFLSWEIKNCGYKFDIHYVRKFFLNFHMLNLLRRMDFASMAASKEARTPFLNRAILSYANKMDINSLIRKRTKEDLRLILDDLNMEHISKSEKVAFSAKEPNQTRIKHYKEFRSVTLKKFDSIMNFL